MSSPVMHGCCVLPGEGWRDVGAMAERGAVPGSGEVEETAEDEDEDDDDYEEDEEGVDEKEELRQSLSRFMLNGVEIDLGMDAADSLPARVEALRIFLEEHLGFDAFVKVYQLMENVSQEDDEVRQAAPPTPLFPQCPTTCPPHLLRAAPALC